MDSHSAVTNPNNPTGVILTAKEMDAIVAQARRVGAYILSDEVEPKSSEGGH